MRVTTKQERGMNLWKATSGLLALVLVGLFVRELYWHRRWQDETLYKLQVSQSEVIQYLQKQIDRSRVVTP